MYAYDPQLSVLLAKKYPHLFEERACYNNVYHMVTEYLEELTPHDRLRVLFCYRQGGDHRYYRHVFCLFDGKLVEPLLYLDMSDYNRHSIVPVRELSIMEYYDLLSQEKETPLRDTLYHADLEAVKKHDISRRLNPYDLANLYRGADEG